MWRKVVIVLVLFGGTAGCEVIGQEDRHEGAHFTTLLPLPETELQARINQYREVNDHEICSTLNEYGLSVGEGCFAPDEIPKEALTREEAVTMAKQALVENERYTNVGSVKTLRVRNAFPLSHDGKPEGAEWRIWFEDQTYQGKRVHDTQIYVWLTADGGYRIGGHWYQNIRFPDDPVSRSEALKAARGYEIVYSDWTGRDTLTVSEDNLPPPDEVKKSILPHKVADTIQLRVVWEVTVADCFFRLYVDGTEGTVLEHDQLVVF